MEETRARELVERYGDLLVRLGYTWLGDLDDAQDVCQTVLLKLLEDQRTFPDQGQERAREKLKTMLGGMMDEL